MNIPVTQAPSEQWLEEASQISHIFNQGIDWKSRLNLAIPLIRKLVIFDNLVIYRPDPTGQFLSLIYARATGRGRSHGAEITWGEPFAKKIVATRNYLLEQDIKEQAGTDRLNKPIMLGIPLITDTSLLGILVFIRFGSPLFDESQIQISIWVAEQLISLMNNQNLRAQLDMAEEERKQAQFQEDFLSAITHELRTPLGFIKGYTTTLLRPDTKWDTEKRKEFLNIIDKETDTLQGLIDDMLDTARLQSGTMPIAFQQVRIEPILRDVIKRIKTQHPDYQIIFQQTSETSAIEGDPRRLAQVFTNMMINAIKYAPSSFITIQTLQRKLGITIIIKDSGPGIPVDELPHVFERFYRGSGSLSKHGSGLGLYICKQIIKSHHGRVTVESTLGKGTKFIIHLPHSQPAKQEIL